MTLPNRISPPGPILQYVQQIANRAKGGDPKAEAALRDTVNAVRAALSSQDGRIFLELLEKSTTEFFLPPDADPCALDALNAQRFIALDLRRIMSDETDRILEQATGVGSGGRTDRRNPRARRK